MTVIANDATTAAVEAVRRGAKALGLTTISTGFSFYPSASLEFDTTGSAPDFAPLITFCSDPVLYGGLVRVVAEAHSRFTRDSDKAFETYAYPHDAYPGDLEDELMLRVNQFLLTESNLWDLAREGGYGYTIPYTVRYYAATYLWSPRIAGYAFCLRCGDLIRYKRRGRGFGPRRTSGPHLRCMPPIWNRGMAGTSRHA